MNNKYRLENRIFNLILIVSIILSGISIFGNIIFKFPISVNIKWIIFILISLIILIRRRKKYVLLDRIIYFSFLIYFMIPVGWVNSGGNSNNTIAYIFLALMSITFLFPGKIRDFFVYSLIFLFIFLYIMDYYFPDWVASYDPQSQFLDRLIQIPITLFITYILLKRFSDAYNEEKNELEKLNEKLDYYANNDPLTNLYNRRFIDQKVKELIALKESSYFSILFDIDDFKKYNDDLGHDYGDKLLRKIGDITKDVFSNDSFNSRWGGDEFYIITSGNEEDIIEKINDFKNRIKDFGNQENKNITISFGVTEIKDEDTYEKLLKRCDKALYKAKENGKNKYVYI